jgi:hypothetical protein
MLAIAMRMQRAFVQAAILHQQESRRSKAKQGVPSRPEFGMDDVPLWWRAAATRQAPFPLDEGQRSALSSTIMSHVIFALQYSIPVTRIVRSSVTLSFNGEPRYLRKDIIIYKVNTRSSAARGHQFLEIPARRHTSGFRARYREK